MEHRASVEVVECEVPVGDGVEGVAHLVRRRREIERRTRKGARADRRRPRLLRCEPEPREISLEHLDPREQVMSDRHRLRPLQVRIAGHRRLCLGLGAVQDDARERTDRVDGLGACVLDIEPHRGRDLVVARAAGVDLPAERTELPLDRRVDVLVGGIDGLDRVERRDDLGELVVREDPGRGKAPRVPRGRFAVVREELRVLRLQELPDLGRELLPDAPGPERQTAAVFRSRAATSSVSSAVIAISPAAALCGNVSPVAYDASDSE